MAAAAVPLLKYLHTVYRPDRDYIDGVLERRNWGDNQHSSLQSMLATSLRLHRNKWQIKAYLEHRVQVAPTRFRIPDVCVMPSSWQNTPIIQQAPLLCIEILSPEDRFKRIQARCSDYFRMGVPTVWIVDPEERLVYILNADGTSQTQAEGTLRLAGSRIELALPEIFSILDETGDATDPNASQS